MPIKTRKHGLAAVLFTAAMTGPASGQAAYECTGIGDEARAEALETAHALRLVWADASGSFLGNVAVSVAAGATLIDTTCAGPMLIAELPPGEYRVSATYEGLTKSATVQVPGGDPVEHTFTF